VAPEPSPPFIHPTADVSAAAVVGAGTQVWRFSHIREGAVVGAGCIIGQGVYVDSEVVIGSHCKLENGVSVHRPAVVEDGVFLGPGVVLTNDRYPRAVHPDGTVKDAAGWTAEGVTIRRGAAVGASSVVLPGVVVGRWAMVGAGSVVTADVADHGLVVGNPARLIGYVCACGRRLPDDPAAAPRRCPSCGRVSAG
jgi:acetyltransferase-like isoleucine patch superfamily enzyme